MNIEKLIHRKASDYIAALHDSDAPEHFPTPKDNHVPLETGKPVGRPPKSGEAATGWIQLRVTMPRKNAYVRAAKPGKLTPWIFEVLDKAAKFDGGNHV